MDVLHQPPEIVLRKISNGTARKCMKTAVVSFKPLQSNPMYRAIHLYALLLKLTGRCTVNH